MRFLLWLGFSTFCGMFTYIWTHDPEQKNHPAILVVLLLLVFGSIFCLDRGIQIMKKLGSLKKEECDEKRY